MKQIKRFILPIAIIAILAMSLVPMISAAVATAVSGPAALGNYTTLTLTCTSPHDADDGLACLNATFHYNASGGAVDFRPGTELCVVHNNTGNDTTFVSTENAACATAFELLTDADNSPGYNWSCVVYNTTFAVNATTHIGSVGIDNTKPTLSVTSDYSSVNLGRYFKYTITLADATTGVTTDSAETYCNITDAEGEVDKDGVISTSASSTDFKNTHVAGTYVISCTATDEAGNTDTSSVTVTAKTTGRPIVSVPEGVGFIQGLDKQTVIIAIVVILLIAMAMSGKGKKK